MYTQTWWEVSVLTSRHPVIRPAAFKATLRKPSISPLAVVTQINLSAVFNMGRFNTLNQTYQSRGRFKQGLFRMFDIFDLHVPLLRPVSNAG